MTNPINISTNSIYYTNKQAKETKPAGISTPNFELSDYKTGQAILARNNISFRNLAVPIEVTDKYNKKVEGKDHLDLPNVHIYEYPDTNLQIFVNADENIINNSDSILDKPKFAVVIENTDYKKHNLVFDSLIKFIMQERLPQINSESFIISYHSDCNNGLEIQKFNKIITDSNFSKVELNNAKEQLKNYLKSDEYKNNTGQFLYKKDELKTKNEILDEIDNIKPEDLKMYYKNYLRHSNIKAFVTISKDYFDKNKTEILRNLNDGLNFKFMNSKEADIVPEFIPNKFRNINNSRAEQKELNFPIENGTSRDFLIAEISNNILNSKNDFGYLIQINYFTTPVNLKNNVPLKYHNTLCTIQPKDPNFSNKDFENTFKNDLSKICNDDLSQELDKLKSYYKDKLKTTFTGERLDLIKNWELISYQDDIFKLYEIIDSITQDDIKDYLKQYLIEQESVMKGEFNNESCKN